MYLLVFLLVQEWIPFNQARVELAKIEQPVVIVLSTKNDEATSIIQNDIAKNFKGLKSFVDLELEPEHGKRFDIFGTYHIPHVVILYKDNGKLTMKKFSNVFDSKEVLKFIRDKRL